MRCDDIFFDNSIVEGGGLNPERFYWIELQSDWVLIPRMIFLGFQTTESNNPLTKLKVWSPSNFKGSFLKPIQPLTTLTWPRIILWYQENRESIYAYCDYSFTMLRKLCTNLWRLNSLWLHEHNLDFIEFSIRIHAPPNHLISSILCSCLDFEWFNA